jgi:hypothetical protein
MLSRIIKKYNISKEDYKEILRAIVQIENRKAMIDGEIFALYKKVRDNIPCEITNKQQEIKADIGPQTATQEWAILYLSQYLDDK